MVDRQTMDLAERRVADRMIAERRRKAREDYVRWASDAADHDLEYRKVRATAFAQAKSRNGVTATEAELEADAAAAQHKHTRDISHVLARAALLMIDETEREATSVRDIHRSSERVDGLAP